MLQEKTHRECNEQYVLEDMQVMSDFELHNLCREFKCLEKYSLTDNDMLCSGKFQHLDKMLPAIKEKVR